MSSADRQGTPFAYHLALRLAATQVPSAQRAEWLAEWRSELWYVGEAISLRPRHASTFSGQRHDRWLMVQFCLGAVDDVRCLRALHGIPQGRSRGSALQCAVLLTLFALFWVALAEMLPGVRLALAPSTYQNASNIVVISPLGTSESDSPPNRLSVVRSWEDRSQHLFTEFAFYEPVVKTVHIGVHNAPELTVGRGSSNLLTLLGVPLISGQASSEDRSIPDLVLSEATWKSHFGGNRFIFGRTIKVGLGLVRLSGVIADEAAPAGRRLDAWMLLPKIDTDQLRGSTRVFAFAKVGEAGRGDRWLMSVGSGTDHRSDYECVALSQWVSETRDIFGFTVLLALLALPATTSLPLGDYAVREVKLPWRTKIRRWLFLGAKVGLILPAIYFGSLDLAYAHPWSGANTARYIQLLTSFSSLLFALRWAFRDQRQRCPVCLRRLICPVRVGQPSRNFLSWSGMELMCSSGHGLLHVPELPTSWFSAPRWLHLDPSWSGLFAGVV